MTTNSRSTSTQSGRPPMNRYGSMAWDHAKRHRPQTLRQLTDPEIHFRQLGQMIETEIRDAMTTRLRAHAGADPPTTEQIRRSVEEEILMTHVHVPDIPTSSASNSNDEQDLDLIDEIPIPSDSVSLEAWLTSPLLDPTN
jgi:hypothetical protein